MKKIMVIGPKNLSEEVVHLLQKLGTVHLTQSDSLQKMSLNEKTSQEFAGKEKLISKLETLLSLLPKPLGKLAETPLGDNMEAWVNEISQKSQDLLQKRQLLSDEWALLQAYGEATKILSPLLASLEGSSHFEALGLIASKKDRNRVESLQKELSLTFTGKVILVQRSVDEDTLGLVLAYPKSLNQNLKSLLNRYGLNELKMPSSLSSYPLQEAVQKMQEKLKQIPQDLKEVDQSLKDLSQQNYSTLLHLKLELEDEMAASKAMRELGQTQKTFVITGYNPEKTLSSLQKTLNEHFQGKIHLEIGECHEAPVLLDNHRWIKPYELFIKVLRPPKYGSIDPTPFFAFFFPIFFGLIMGDIGYGLVFLALGLWLRLSKKQEFLKHVSEIVIVCSLYTILFGFVFGEFFGDFLEKKGILHPLTMHLGGTTIKWDRMHSLIPLLALAIGIGVFHVTLGFILKLIQSIRHRHTHEIIEVIAILVSLAGLFVLIGVLAQQIPTVVKIPSVIALVIGVPLLIYMKGPMMIMELLSFVGNMLSYARLMAVGVASAYLAFVGNMLGGLVGNVILGAIIAILFHIINMALAFSPTIQSARLHYVEFFTKFYESGGSIYQPLARKKVKLK
ncbi:MAG: hypothetical protein HYS08_01895 [Chlamydiae bacterium]|nr:hypothetical protein [Chlamydiota bacterium]MBI3266835.1 hypothetical protein [Chlamydiota bacterium]